MRRLIIIGALAYVTVAFGSSPRNAWALTIGNTFHFTDNRGPNPLGIATGHRQFIQANITPSGPSVTATATQDSTTLSMSFIGQTLFPDRFGVARPFDNTLLGSWQIDATDGMTAGPVSTPPIDNPQLIPPLQNVQVVGPGTTPTVTWTLPDLAAVEVDRIQVRAQDATTGDQSFRSMSLPITDTSFMIPSGVLDLGRPVAFRIVLDDLEGGGRGLENRSSAWSSVFTPVPEPTTLLLFSSGLVGLGVSVTRRRNWNGS